MCASESFSKLKRRSCTCSADGENFLKHRFLESLSKFYHFFPGFSGYISNFHLKTLKLWTELKTRKFLCSQKFSHGEKLRQKTCKLVNCQLQIKTKKPSPPKFDQLNPTLTIYNIQPTILNKHLELKSFTFCQSVISTINNSHHSILWSSS